MRLMNVFTSRWAVGLGLSTSSITPPRIGYPLANGIARLVAARRTSAMAMAVRANQWIVHDEHISAAELDLAVLRVFQNMGRGLYDFFHYINNPEAFRRMVVFDAPYEAAFERAKRNRCGTIYVAPHMAGFDVIGRAMVLRGTPMQFLTYPDPPGGYQWQNALRELPGARITPMSIDAFRAASQTLAAGGAVVTGVDRPLPKPDSKYRPRIFRRPAIMPVFHIKLALRHKLPITVISGYLREDGHSAAGASEPIPMEHRPDPVEETVVNAERVLLVIARDIRKAPDLWGMLYPVWPESLAAMPA